MKFLYILEIFKIKKKNPNPNLNPHFQHIQTFPAPNYPDFPNPPKNQRNRHKKPPQP